MSSRLIRLDGIRLRNPLNGSHGSWAVAARARKTQRAAARAHVLAAFGGGELPSPVGLVVTIVRVAPRPLDDDALPASAKSIRDGVADAFGVDDGPKGPLEWRYAQRNEGRDLYCVEIRLSTATSAEAIA